MWYEIVYEGQGIKVLICDFINVFVKYLGCLEVVLVDLLCEFIVVQNQMVVVIIFVSNIVWLCMLVDVVIVLGCKICFLGCVMCCMVIVGIEIGILMNFFLVISFEDVVEMLCDKVMLIVIGSQGECCVVSV